MRAVKRRPMTQAEINKAINEMKKNTKEIRSRMYYTKPRNKLLLKGNK